MDSTMGSWVARVADQPVPILRSTRELFASASEADLDSVDTVVDWVGRDAGLALNVVMRANGTHHEHLGHRLTTLSYTIMMLGLAKVQRMALSLPVLEDTVDGPALAALHRGYARAYHAACQVRAWARRRHNWGPEELYLAALLHTLGELVLCRHIPKEFLQLEDQVWRQRVAAEEAQYLTLGFTLGEFAHDLARHWRLPPLIQECLQPGNASNPRVLGVQLAVQLVRLAEYGWDTPQMRECLAQVAEYIDADPEQAAELVRAEAEAYAWRVPVYYEVCGENAPAQLAAAHCPAPAADAGQGKYCLIPQLPVLNEALQRLQASVGEAFNLDEMIDYVVKSLHDGAGLNRVVFALVSHDREELSAKAIAGPGHDPVFDRFRVRLGGKDLFSVMMRRPGAAWVIKSAHGGPWALVPEDFRKMVQAEAFFIQSVFAGDRPLGLLYADRWGGECALDQVAYRRFRAVAGLTQRALERRLHREKKAASG